MSAYQSFLPQIMPFVTPCPKGLVMDALRYVGTDFFVRSRAWQYVCPDALTAGRNELDLPTGSELVRVDLALLGGVRLILGIDYRIVPPASVDVLVPRVCRTGSCAESCLVVTLKPCRDAEGLPDELATAWGDALVYGTLAKVKAMSGKSVAWSDPDGATLNLSLYENEAMRARTERVGNLAGARMNWGTR